MISLLVCVLPLLIGSDCVIAPSDNVGFSVIGFAALVSFGIFPIGSTFSAAGPRYVPKWKQQACEIPASQHPSSHYICDESGEVKCLSGWTGDLCDVPICKKGCDPLQGYCRRPGECRCKIGFYGESCDKCIPLPGCQHGRCNGSFECACEPGWKGLFCSEPICDSECSSHQSYCDLPGECKCLIGWYGPKCKTCTVIPGCAHGTCQTPFQCNCDRGWTGLLCNKPLCAQGCSRENGGCWKPDTCRCKVGWTGENCTKCVPYPGCVHGTCGQKPWTCRCKPGWTGEHCDTKLTFCDDHKNICQNNGTCVSLTKEDGDYRCICPMGYMGRQCQAAAQEPATDLTPPEVPDNQEKPTTVELTTKNPTTISIVDNNNNTLEESATKISTTLLNHESLPEAVNATEKKDNLNSTKIITTTIKPIIITGIPWSTAEPAATAGKWPTESPTKPTFTTDSDADNEA